MKSWRLIALVLATAIGFSAGIITLGGDRAMRIAATAMMATLVDGQIERPVPSTLPVFDVEVSESDLAALNSDLPWSGGESKPGTISFAGSSLPMKFRYRGLVVTSHYLGPKKSFRVTFEGDTPFGHMRRMNFINPKTPDMLNVHMALWVGRAMNVAAPFDDFAFVRINGRDIGVMEMTQQIDGGFEQDTSLASREVPVFKGDFPAAVGRSIPDRQPLWKDPHNWVFTGNADSADAVTRLGALIEVIGAAVPPATARDSALQRLIDIEAYLRYAAALQVIGTQHIDNYHNQWLVQDPADSLFFPVLWDPLMLFVPTGEPWYPIHDALAFRVLSEARWRLARDRNIWHALQQLHDGHLFTQEFRRTLDRIRPAVLADRNKCTGITVNSMDVFPYSITQFAKAAGALQRDVASYWDRLEEQCVVRDLEIRTVASGIHVTFRGPCAVRLEWPRNDVDSTGVSALPIGTSLVRAKDRWILTIVPSVEQRGEGSGSPFADGTWFEPLPVDLTFSFPSGAPLELRAFNAVTDAPIDRRP